MEMCCVLQVKLTSFPGGKLCVEKEMWCKVVKPNFENGGFFSVSVLHKNCCSCPAICLTFKDRR